MSGIKYILLLCIFTDVPASGMYFLTYEFIKKKVAESAPKDKPQSKSRELAGTIFAGGMGEVKCDLFGKLTKLFFLYSWHRELVHWNASRCAKKSLANSSGRNIS